MNSHLSTIFVATIVHIKRCSVFVLVATRVLILALQPGICGSNMSTPIWTRLLNIAGTAPSCGLRGFIQTHIGVLVAVRRSDPSHAAVVSTVWNFVDVVQFFIDGDWLEPRTCPTHTSSIAQSTGIPIVHAGGVQCHRAMPSSIDVHSTNGRSQGGESGTWPADEPKEFDWSGGYRNWRGREPIDGLPI